MCKGPGEGKNLAYLENSSLEWEKGSHEAGNGIRDQMVQDEADLGYYLEEGMESL